MLVFGYQLEWCGEQTNDVWTEVGGVLSLPIKFKEAKDVAVVVEVGEVIFPRVYVV